MLRSQSVVHTHVDALLLVLAWVHMASGQLPSTSRSERETASPAFPRAPLVPNAELTLPSGK